MQRRWNRTHLFKPAGTTMNRKVVLRVESSVAITGGPQSVLL